MMNSLRFAALVATLTTMSPALAEVPLHAPVVQSPEWLAQQQQSQSQALGVRQLAVYKRKPGKGTEQMANEILANLPALGFTQDEIENAKVATRGDVTVVAGESWILHVAGEGRYARVWRSALGGQAVPIQTRMSYNEVAARCGPLRAIVAGATGISNTEAMQLLTVSYMGRGMVDREGNTIASETLGAFATYGRVVDGVPVVGTGSYVKIGIDVEGNLLGFDVDWSEYEATGTSQTTVSKGELMSRLAKLGPIGSIENVACGYYDPGTQGTNALELLQPACSYTMTTASGRVHAVLPAGEHFVTDNRWLETAALSSLQ